MQKPYTLQSRWLFPITGPPLERGTLTIAGDRIVAVEPAGRTKPDIDLGNVAVLPGLVNAHTHLDLSGLRGHKLPRAFVDWLRAVVAYRRGSKPSEWRSAVSAGVEESLLSGTTLLGDISVGGLSAASLAASPLRAVVFHEILGLTKTRARETLQQAGAWLRDQSPSPHLRFGLSPHAPYSVRRGLWRWAGRRGFTLAIHWFETREEVELLHSHAGPLRALLEEIGAWDERGLPPSHQWIERRLRHVPRLLFVHANYLPFVPTHSVVYCPRTHAYFSHAEHPFRDFLAAGVKVALGTDSLASNPDLSILNEMRFLWDHYSGRLAGADLLRMGTLNGAAALGWESETGSLAPGKAADWVAVPLDSAASGDPYDLLFASRQPVQHACIGGEWVVRDGRIQKPGFLEKPGF